jgi:arsenate reductase
VQAGIDPVTQHHVEEMTERLVTEFGDRVEHDRIQALMEDSLGQLAGPARVPDFLPVLAYRFTRERLASISRTPGTTLDVVFVSLSGGGRGQMAAALTTLLSDGKVTAHAAGTSRHGFLDPVVETVIRELGVDTSEFYVRPVSSDILAAADVIVTMGQSVGEVGLPEGARREDWRVGDPVGADLEEVRRVREDIERRVLELLVELGVLAGSKPDAHSP